MEPMQNRWLSLNDSMEYFHGTGVFTYTWLFFMINVGKYTVRPMDPMGILYFLVENLHRAIWSLRRGLKAWPCAGELCTCEAVLLGGSSQLVCGE